MKMKFAKGVILWPFVGVTLLLAGIVGADIDPDIKEILSDVMPKVNSTANATKPAENDPLHISAVENRFSAAFCDVPAPSRVDPASTSGPLSSNT